MTLSWSGNNYRWQTTSTTSSKMMDPLCTRRCGTEMSRWRRCSSPLEPMSTVPATILAGTQSDIVHGNRQGAMIDLLRRHGAVASDPAREQFVLRSPPSLLDQDLLWIEALSERVEGFLEKCEINCVAGCCGVDAYCFSAAIVRPAAMEVGAKELISDLRTLRSTLEASSKPTVVINSLNNLLDRQDVINFLIHLESLCAGNIPNPVRT